MTSLPCSFCCFIINMSFHLLSSSSYDFCLSLLCLALIYAITKQSSSSGERFSQNKGLSVNQTSLTEEPLHSVTLHSLPVFLRVVLKTTTTTTTSKGIQFKQMISSASILSEFDFPDKSTCNLDKGIFVLCFILIIKAVKFSQHSFSVMSHLNVIWCKLYFMISMIVIRTFEHNCNYNCFCYTSLNITNTSFYLSLRLCRPKKSMTTKLGCKILECKFYSSFPRLSSFLFFFYFIHD